MSEADIIMPIGRYKGKPLMNIKRKDLEWFLEQEWFEEQYPELYKDIEAHLERRDRSYDTY